MHPKTYPHALVVPEEKVNLFRCEFKGKVEIQYWAVKNLHATVEREKGDYNIWIELINQTKQRARICVGTIIIDDMPWGKETIQIKNAVWPKRLAAAITHRLNPKIVLELIPLRNKTGPHYKIRFTSGKKEMVKEIDLGSLFDFLKH